MRSSLEIEAVPGGQLVRRGRFGRWRKGDVIPSATWDAYMAGEMVEVSPGISYQRH